MDNRDEVRDFLTSRRERITPEQAGLQLYGGNRRVKGLRREEVAILSGMSVDYYTRLERGNLAGASEPVLESLSRALRLDEAERSHLFDLARTANTGASAMRARRAAARTTVRPGVQLVLDSIDRAPAYVRNGRFDVVAANRLGRALFADAYVEGSFNVARFLFLDDRARDYYVQWEVVARECVASLRQESGRNPHDTGLGDLVGELSTRSEEFRTWWAAHHVGFHRTATKKLRHPVVGEIELTGEALELPGDDGLRIIAYTVEPNSPSQAALEFLDSWASTATRTATRDDQHLS